jgi:hypothetical protein
MKYVAAASDSNVSLRPDPSWLFLISGNVNIASIARQIGKRRSFLKKYSQLLGDSPFEAATRERSMAGWFVDVLRTTMYGLQSGTL